MEIQNLVREKVIGNIKTGTKGEKGLPKKLPYFNVEEDKVTSKDMVDIFKQLYPDKPTNLKIMFTSEDPFNFKFKRYVNNKAVCIGNDVKAITIGKDDKGKSSQIEVECSKNCEQRLTGKCKLVGSLKFVLDGIDAGGVWKINTSGGFSLSNIASEIYKYKKAGMSIVGVPFELKLDAQESLAYGTYYSIDLHRTDVKPVLTGQTLPQIEQKTLPQVKQSTQETKQLTEGKMEEKEEQKETKNTKVKPNKTEEKKETEVIEMPKEENKTEDSEDKDLLIIKDTKKEKIGSNEFDKMIFQDINGQDVEYVIHPKADKKILDCLPGSVIVIKKSKLEANMNILCTYEIKDAMYKNENELKEAV